MGKKYYLMMKVTSGLSSKRLDECRIINLSKISDPRGILTIINSNENIPFEIKRIFYIYNIPKGEKRGNHANRSVKELIICLAGGFDVNLDDGFKKKVIHLDKPWQGLFIPPMIWASESNYEEGTICLALASEEYDVSKYYNDYNEFLKAVRKIE